MTPHEEFGTYEKVSDDPLTVEYTINEAAVWSDGVPIDCDDVQLWWTQNSGAIDGLFSAVGIQGIEDTTRPECEPGGKSFTLSTTPRTPTGRPPARVWATTRSCRRTSSPVRAV